jgi:hypothetical protein
MVSFAHNLQPADRIEAICIASGFFKLVNGAIVLAAPAAQLPIVSNYGIDLCLKRPPA